MLSPLCQTADCGGHRGNVDISAETWEELQSFVDRVCRPVTTAQAQSNWVALDGITGILCVRACMFMCVCNGSHGGVRPRAATEAPED